MADHSHGPQPCQSQPSVSPRRKAGATRARTIMRLHWLGPCRRMMGRLFAGTTGEDTVRRSSPAQSVSCRTPEVENHPHRPGRAARGPPAAARRPARPDLRQAMSPRCANGLEGRASTARPRAKYLLDGRRRRRADPHLGMWGRLLIAEDSGAPSARPPHLETTTDTWCASMTHAFGLVDLTSEASSPTTSCSRAGPELGNDFNGPCVRRRWPQATHKAALLDQKWSPPREHLCPENLSGPGCRQAACPTVQGERASASPGGPPAQRGDAAGGRPCATMFRPRVSLLFQTACRLRRRPPGLPGLRLRAGAHRRIRARQGARFLLSPGSAS